MKSHVLAFECSYEHGFLLARRCSVGGRVVVVRGTNSWFCGVKSRILDGVSWLLRDGHLCGATARTPGSFLRRGSDRVLECGDDEELWVARRTLRAGRKGPHDQSRSHRKTMAVSKARSKTKSKDILLPGSFKRAPRSLLGGVSGQWDIVVGGCPAHFSCSCISLV